MFMKSFICFELMKLNIKFQKRPEIYTFYFRSRNCHRFIGIFFSIEYFKIYCNICQNASLKIYIYVTWKERVEIRISMCFTPTCKHVQVKKYAFISFPSSIIKIYILKTLKNQNFWQFVTQKGEMEFRYDLTRKELFIECL